MSYSPDELKDYLLDELPAPRRAEVEAVLRGSSVARAELARQRFLLQALRSLPQEEIPQRIAFVSDPILEPTARQKLWLGIWAGAPRLGAAAALLALALAGGIWASNPVVSRHETGWTVSFGGAEGAPAPGVSEAQLRTALREEWTRSEARWSRAVLQASQSAAEADWVRSQLAEIRREMAQMHEDAVAGYEFVNAKHELLKKQLFEVDVALFQEVGR